MEEKAIGIILRVRPLTESSLIIHWLTKESGRIATVAKGARRPKSTFRGKLDLFFTAEFTMQRSRRSELHVLRELALINTNEILRTSIEYLSQCAYAAAFIEQVTESDTPLPEIFDLFRGYLEYFRTNPQGVLHVFAFEVKMLEHLGLQPDLAESRLSEGSRKILQHCASAPWQSLAMLRPSEAQTNEIKNFLNSFLVFNLGRVPANRATALS